jgi:VWFA-related protein
MRLLLVAVLIVGAIQAPPQPQRPVIRSGVIRVSTDLVVRDERGQFVADLREEDLEIYEDGVKQTIASFSLIHGGRVIADRPPMAATAGPGLLLPPVRPPGDASGRAFLFVIDDLHLDFSNTGRLRDLLKRISSELVHDGDLIAIVSTGPSSIAVDLTYDRTRLDEAIRRVSGAALKPAEIMETPGGASGQAEIRYRAHVAFSTAYEIVQKLELLHSRRKICVYISNGYDFDPFSRSRAQAGAGRFSFDSWRGAGDVPDTNPFGRRGDEFAAADLAAELAELTRQANRANTTIYTIDPRGLAGPVPDPSQAKVDPQDWQDHLRETQSSLRVLADLTGGFAVVNSNDFAKALKRIDNETSDYYMIGYNSSNADPRKTRRTIEIRVKSTSGRKADRYEISYRRSYALQPR